jgi:hypothetical protein
MSRASSTLERDVLVRKLEGKNLLGKLGRKWEDNIKTDLKPE